MEVSETSFNHSNTTIISNPSINTPIQPHNHPISIKLNESNYLIWKQQVLTTVRGYGLEAFLTGESKPPPEYIVDGDTQETRINPEYLNC